MPEKLEKLFFPFQPLKLFRVANNPMFSKLEYLVQIDWVGLYVGL